MKKLPIGIQSFKKLRESNYLYADKTAYIYKMIQSEGSIFLSRPRRFGKSLLVSTLEELFLGNKELFQGLWIDSSGYDYQPYPVVHLDMNKFSTVSLELFRKDLLSELKAILSSEGLREDDVSLGALLGKLIQQMSEKYKKRVVLLIDEYDKPILDNLHTVRGEAMRDELRAVYGILKSMDSYLRFVFMTGVSKFSKTSVFSGANQFNDITMHPRYANICGIEKNKLEEFFSEFLDNDIAERLERIQQICDWYDGYSWDGISFLFNPFSLLSYFERGEFKSFWYETGSPTFLINLIKKDPSRYTIQEPYEITEGSLNAADIDKLSIIPLLFQTGYLTVASRPKRRDRYELKVPNKEVDEAFHKHLLIALSELPEESALKISDSILEAFQDGAPERLQPLLVSLFSSIPYQLHIDAESYYHSIFFVLLKLIGASVSAEISVGLGRTDVVLKTSEYIYIIEWKYCKSDINAVDETKGRLLDNAVEEAREQIRSKGYSKPYLADKQKIIEVGVAVTARTNVLVRVF